MATPVWSPPLLNAPRYSIVWGFLRTYLSYKFKHLSVFSQRALASSGGDVFDTFKKRQLSLYASVMMWSVMHDSNRWLNSFSFVVGTPIFTLKCNYLAFSHESVAMAAVMAVFLKYINSTMAAPSWISLLSEAIKAACWNWIIDMSPQDQNISAILCACTSVANLRPSSRFEGHTSRNFQAGHN